MGSGDGHGALELVPGRSAQEELSRRGWFVQDLEVRTRDSDGLLQLCAPHVVFEGRRQVSLRG